ncbi:MAG TPA: TonB-dependent receptor [Bacteroidales bacterium]|nr:TonB-dependent receptor [Bacteroidales bacterium]
MGKTLRRTLVLAGILIGIATGAWAQKGVIKGRVFDHKNNEPVPFANIIIDGKPTQGTTTDLNGKFTLAGIDPGYVRLVVSSVGYKKYTSPDVLVTNAYPVYQDIPLDQLVVTLEAVDIKPATVTRKEEAPLSLQTLTIQEIEKSPGSNRDISKVIQSLPGVAPTLANRNDVVVRGGGPSENRYFLDGVEIQNINHFATQGASGGPVGIINVDLVRDLELYTSAFPAKRGNALSSVLELYQVDGNKEKFGGRITVGASDFGLTLDGPITKNSTLIFSVRRSYLQLLFSLLKLPFLPTYNDYQLKYRIDFDRKNRLSVISIGALDNSKLNTGIKNPDETQRYILGYLPTYKQWSYTFGLVFNHFRKKGYDTYVLSRSMLDNEEIKYQNNVELPDSLLLNYKSQEAENKFRYEGLTDLVDWKITYGAGAEYDEYTNQTYQKIFLADSVQTLDYRSTLYFFKWSLFGQVSKDFFNDRLNLTLGLRMDANSYSGEMDNLLRQLSPRFVASYALLRDKLFLNFNTGRYYQLPAYTTLGFRDNNGTLINKDLGIRYISCDHIVLGLEYHPKKNSKITAEGFYKYYKHYPMSVLDSVSLASKGTDYGVVGDEPVLPDSKGRAYGFELFYRDADLFKFNIMLSYTFVRSEFTDASGAYLPSSWDNRNLFNITIGRKFKYNWQVGVKWRYAGGAPYTPYDLDKSSRVSAWDAQGKGYLDYSEYNSLRLRSFNQLDIRVDKGFFFKKWSLMVYADVQNVLNYKAQQPDYLVNTQPDGSVVKYVDPQGVERYKLRLIPNTIGTILPAVGIMVDF